MNSIILSIQKIQVRNLWSPKYTNYSLEQHIIEKQTYYSYYVYRFKRLAHEKILYIKTQRITGSKQIELTTALFNDSLRTLNKKLELENCYTSTLYIPWHVFRLATGDWWAQGFAFFLPKQAFCRPNFICGGQPFLHSSPRGVLHLLRTSIVGQDPSQRSHCGDKRLAKYKLHISIKFWKYQIQCDNDIIYITWTGHWIIRLHQMRSFKDELWCV